MEDINLFILKIFDPNFVNLLIVNLTSLSVLFIFMPGIGGGVSGIMLRAPIILAVGFCVTIIEVQRGYTISSVEETIILTSIKSFAISLIPLILAGSIRLAGYLIGVSSGLNFAGIIDPALGQNQGELPRLFGDLKVLIFLTSGGHLILFQALLDVTSIFNSLSLPEITQFLVDLFCKTFALGFTFAIPMIGGIFLVNLAMGLISKAVPTFNVFVMGYPLTLLVGVYFAFFFLSNFPSYYSKLLELLL